MSIRFSDSDQTNDFQVKNHIWVFVNTLIENPTFDSQTKENMTLQAKSFGSKCEPTEKFINAVCLMFMFYHCFKYSNLHMFIRRKQ